MEIFCPHYIYSVSWCFYRPWSLLSHQTWFHGWSTTGLSLCTHMEITSITPWRATSTAHCLYSTQKISPTPAGPLQTSASSPPAGTGSATDVKCLLHSYNKWYFFSVSFKSFLLKNTCNSLGNKIQSDILLSHNSFERNINCKNNRWWWTQWMKHNLSKSNTWKKNVN